LQTQAGHVPGEGAAGVGCKGKARAVCWRAWCGTRVHELFARVHAEEPVLAEGSADGRTGATSATGVQFESSSSFVAEEHTHGRGSGLKHLHGQGLDQTMVAGAEGWLQERRGCRRYLECSQAVGGVCAVNGGVNRAP